MTEKYYVYEIQAFAYSNFEHYIILHKTKFSKIEFRKMIEKARQKAKAITETDIEFWKYYYPITFIEILKEDYGFIESNHLVAHVGCDYDDICEVERE